MRRQLLEIEGVVFSTTFGSAFNESPAGRLDRGYWSVAINPLPARIFFRQASPPTSTCRLPANDNCSDPTISRLEIRIQKFRLQARNSEIPAVLTVIWTPNSNINHPFSLCHFLYHAHNHSPPRPNTPCLSSTNYNVHHLLYIPYASFTAHLAVFYARPE